MQNQITKDRITGIHNLMIQGAESWIKAGTDIAAAIDDDPEFIDKFCDEFPDVSPETVCRFELIGRKKLHPQTLLSDASGMRRLRKMPYQLQEKYVAEPLPVLLKRENGWETLKVDVRNLTPDQALQVFGHNEIRSEAAQRAWIEDRLTAKRLEPVESDLPYRIVKGECVVTIPCRLTRRDIALINSELAR